ncbi:MAG: hypothetical protein CL609_15070 [Anaerolineaceae bacterium]|nr:hypothetical protein [Anaerolineaceae bacterium]
MKRTTIDYGIDLGTTNSAIAVVNNTESEVIKNNDNLDFTPSAIWIDAKERIYIGQQAKRRILKNPEDVQVEFKRKMGTSMSVTFSSGKSMLPEELSAEILKSLKNDVLQRKGETIRSVVITVPAAFEYPQIEATKKAASLSGFEQAIIIQEPFAAALAYGFTNKDDNKFWLVYDLGGGTFDAALIQMRDGQFHLIEHGGDNALGGKNLDEMIVQEIILPKICEDLGIEDPMIILSNKANKVILAKLKAEAERIKIELSQRKTATLFVDDLFKDKDYVLDMDIRQEQIAALHLEDIDKTINYCKTVIKNAGVPESKIEKLILVGGPTLAPYLRERLTDKTYGLAIPLEYSQDPITVVAQGAALYASTIQTQVKEETDQDSNETAKIAFSYSPVGIDNEPFVGGTVTLLTSEKELSNYQIEFSRENTLQQWISPRIPLDGKGNFMATLFAEEGIRNEFIIRLYDEKGDLIPVNPEKITYMIANTPSNPPVIHSLGVALANNETLVFVEKGKTLPARQLKVLRTTQYVEKGMETDLINIPLIEGEHKRADRNSQIGNLFIFAKDIQRDIPAGSEVEVSINIDESRLLVATAYLPILDEEFDAKLNLQSNIFNEKESEEELRLQQLRYQRLTQQLEENEHIELKNKVMKSGIPERTIKIENNIKMIQSDEGKSTNLPKEINELKLEIDKIEDEIKWPVLIKEAEEEIGYCGNVVNQLANEKGKNYYAGLCAEINEAIKNNDVERLEIKLNDLTHLKFTLLRTDPEFLAYIIQIIEEDIQNARDPQAVQNIINQAKEQLANRELDRVDRLIGKAYRYFDEDELIKLKSGYGSTVMR